MYRHSVGIALAIALWWRHTAHYVVWQSLVEAAVILALGLGVYALHYVVVVWVFEMVDSPADLLFMCCTGRRTQRATKQACCMAYGKQFDFDEKHYEDYLLQDEEPDDITWYDRSIARHLSFLCWPSTCFASELATVLLANDISSNDVLLDVGCGLGLAMLTFHDALPCKRVHGIELCDRLYNVCAENLAKVDSHRLVVEKADATKFEIPSDVTFVYMYNSFQDRLGLTDHEQHDLFIDRVQATLDVSPRRVLLLLYDCDDFYAAYNEAFTMRSSGKAGQDSFAVFECTKSD